MTLAERRLLRLFRSLPEAKQASLLDFAEFLQVREIPEPEAVSLTPLSIERPAQESVVKAIKRLRETYPMLDRAKLIHETSALMSQHLVQGRTALEVINDLEALFARHFQTLQNPQ
ncbi:MAG: hypothetical protein B7Y41_00070 [Hydrogenophilales bacterium 28-61-23]|nr:MAG: hypothetical protein B7Y41_00070 [Hydrogenophilales bacterium 28-61-23]